MVFNMRCTHSGCSGTLVEKPDEKSGPNVFECNSCHCVYRLTNVRKDAGCPSLKGVPVSKKKGTKVWVNVAEGSQPVIKELPLVSGESESQSLNASDASIKGKRGRPKGSKNKK
jgi:hypothetical protein